MLSFAGMIWELVLWSQTTHNFKCLIHTQGTWFYHSYLNQMLQLMFVYAKWNNTTLQDDDNNRNNNSI